MMCSTHIDESAIYINYYAAVTSLGTFSEKLNHLYIPHMMHGSRNNAEVEETSVTAMVWCL
jgi:hypothetical protein